MNNKRKDMSLIISIKRHDNYKKTDEAIKNIESFVALIIDKHGEVVEECERYYYSLPSETIIEYTSFINEKRGSNCTYSKYFIEDKDIVKIFKRYDIKNIIYNFEEITLKSFMEHKYLNKIKLSNINKIDVRKLYLKSELSINSFYPSIESSLHTIKYCKDKFKDYTLKYVDVNELNYNNVMDETYGLLEMIHAYSYHCKKLDNKKDMNDLYLIKKDFKND